jgi:hypothetical protein
VCDLVIPRPLGPFLCVLVASSVLALPGELLAQGKGRGQGRAGRARSAAPPAAKPSPSAPQKPIPPFNPKKGSKRSIRYQIIEGRDRPERLLLIGGDGAVQLRGGDLPTKSIRLNRTKLRQLASEIRKSGFFREHEAVYGDRSLNPDPRSRTITIPKRSGAMSVQVFDDPKHPPPAGFARLSFLFDKLIRRMDRVPAAKIPVSGIGVTAPTVRAEYVLPAGGEPSRMVVALAINNSSDDPIRMEFPSEQKYDFAIRDAEGHEVYVWSRSREFEPKPSRLVLQRQGVSFTEHFPLAGASGAPLPAGDYILEWRLAGGLGYSGRVPFRVSSPPEPGAAENEKAARAQAKAKARAAGKGAQGGGGGGAGGNRRAGGRNHSP